jgi:hypothetical protein
MAYASKAPEQQQALAYVGAVACFVAAVLALIVLQGFSEAIRLAVEVADDVRAMSARA